jgi:glyoxylase-like metal-dependent hydrolase (beta-lactamase superfamily II)
MEIADGVYSIGNEKGGHVRAFLLDDGTDLTLIDTLFETDAQLILEQIGRTNRTIADLKRIVLTHAHRSHLGGLAELKRLSGATICAHEWEADIIAGERKAQASWRQLLRPYAGYLKVYPLQVAFALGLDSHPPCPVDRILEDGDQAGPVQVLHTPGHSPGHLAFYWPDRRVLFAGDAVCTWPSFGAGWPALNLNLVQHRASLERMAKLDAIAVGVGHGDPFTSGATARLHSLAETIGQSSQKSP